MFENLISIAQIFTLDRLNAGLNCSLFSEQIPVLTSFLFFLLLYPFFISVRPEELRDIPLLLSSFFLLIHEAEGFTPHLVPPSSNGVRPEAEWVVPKNAEEPKGCAVKAVLSDEGGPTHSANPY